MNIGPLKSGKTVRDSAQATLQLWLPSVLPAIEADYDLPAGSLPVPAASAYHQATRADTLLPVTARPAIVLATPDRVLHRRGRGSVDATFTLLVSTLSGGKSFEDTLDNADFYALAAEVCLSQHPSLAPYDSDPVASSVTPVGSAYAPIGEGDRTVMRVVVEFAVGVRDVMDVTAGPLEPDTDWPFPVEITETEITLERMET